MARWTEPTLEQEQGWRDWVAERPDSVRALAERFPPWELFRMKDTGQRVTVYSFSEDGTITVNVTGQFNRLDFERQVFGIDPDNLEPCDLPTPDEPLGAELVGDEVDDHIDELRVKYRPDLWVMGPDGKAIRTQ